MALKTEHVCGFIRSKALRRAINAIPSQIKEMSDDELKRRIKPTKLLWQLKQRYLYILSNPPKKMSDLYKIKDLYGGICTYTHLYCNILNNPYKTAWLIKLSSNFEDQIEIGEREAIDKLLELIRGPVFKENGSINTKAANIAIRAADVIFNFYDKKIK